MPAGVLTLGLAAALCALAWLFAPSAMTKLPDAGRVLYIETEGFAEHGRTYVKALEKKVARLLPEHPPVWMFAECSPNDRDAILRAIADSAPDVVVFSTIDLYLPIAATPTTAKLLISTEWPVKLIEARLERLDAANQVVFVSWFVPVFSKLFELGGAFVPGGLRRIVELHDQDVVTGGVSDAFDAAAAKRGLAIQSALYDDFGSFSRQLALAENGRADALFLPLTPTLTHNLTAVADRIAATQLPAMYTQRYSVEHGGLLSVDGPPEEVADQIALYVTLLLRGVAPRELKILTPSRLEITVNLTAAYRIGRPVPYELLAEATEIVD